jgi:hypothetical protein
MMNTSMSRLIVPFVLVAVLLTGCDNVLQEEPTSFIGPDNFYRNAEDALAALSGAYSEISSGSFGGYIGSYQFMRHFEKPSPEVGVGTNTPEFILDEFTWTPDATERGALPEFYASAYQGIKAANAVIDNVPGIENMDTQLQTRIIAEARFLRALHYYHLVGVFGGVPLYAEEIRSLDNIAKPRAPEDSVYIFIIDDLEQAIPDLPVASVYGASQKERASKGAAQTLLAKTYLQRGSLNPDNGPLPPEREIAQPGDYQAAATLLQEVIDSGEYSLPDDLVTQYTALFIEEEPGAVNPEIIFALQSDPAVGYTSSAPCLTISEVAGSELAGASWNQHTSELPFFTSFEDEDLRKDVTFLLEFPNEAGEVVTYDIDNVEGDGVPEDSPPFRKYSKAAPGEQCADDNDWIILRYADVLLMLAEALNEVNQGPTPAAYDAINQVRERAGLDPLSGLDYASFREAVYTENRKELVAEGQGWWTMNRFWDIAERRIREHAEFDAQFPPERQFGPRLDRLAIEAPKHRVFPIPSSSISRNPQLTQNPGY